MHITFGRRGIVEVNDARITFKNFEGRREKYNENGERNFSLIIPNEEIADALTNDKNEFGVGWNVKIKPPRDGYDQPFMYLKIKVGFNGRGPDIHLISGNKRTLLDEDSVGILDKMDIEKVDLDIRPFDDEGRFGPFRSAWLQSMEVTQRLSRFEARYAEEEYPEE